MPVMSTVATVSAAPPAATRSFALVRLSLTELKLLSRERVRMALPVAIPLLLIIILGSIHPLGAAVPALTAATQGSFPTALQLLTMAGWAVAFGLAAARFFRWE